MFINEQYKLYKLADYLVTDEGFHILHINVKTNEVWLEKYANRTSIIIRLIHRGFDWGNHLKKDIAVVFQKVKNMKRLLSGRVVEVHNVYVSSHAPVDDWSSLKQPLKLNEKKNPITMKVYYLNEEEENEEAKRLFQTLGIEGIPSSDNLIEVDQEEKVRSYKKSLIQSLQNRKKEMDSLFSYGKPRFIYFLIAINLLIYFLMESYGDSSSIDTLIQFGAKFNVAMMEEGEWWRIISSMFIHIGFLHLFMNMLAVYYLGIVVERIYGSVRFLFIYMLAGIGGGIASFAFSTNVSAGASGAIFGLFGALLFFGLMHKRIFFRTMGMNVLLILAINIVLGFLVPQIDMAAHLGGLVTGLIAAQIAYLPNKRNIVKQIGGLLLYVVLIGAIFFIGINNNEQNQEYHLMYIEQLLAEREYEEIINIADMALELEGNQEGMLLFQRSYAYIELNQYEKAIKDLEESLTYEIFPQTYYNLALLYYQQGNISEAKENAKKAYYMQPSDESFVKLYEEIMGE